MTGRLTAEHRESYARDGYFVLPDAVGGQTLAQLRAEADLAVDWQEAKMARGETVDTINHHGEHYFIPRRSLDRPAISDYVRSPVMVEICAALLGDDAYLFTELFICKEPHNTIPFDWHQDTGYIHAFGFTEYPPNVTVWTALDDMTADNGALWAFPYSENGPRVVVPHAPDQYDNQVAQIEVTSKRLLEVPAGALVVLAGTLIHRSEPNRTAQRRRAHLTQFGPQPIVVNGEPIQLAVPIIENGVPASP